MNMPIAVLVTGVGATLLLDLWAILRRLVLGTPLPNYALVGRWIAGMRHGQFMHESIAAAAPVRGELAIGWITHYLVGIAFAAVLIAIWGQGWVQDPTPGPALLVGLLSVAAPWLVMQPGMGAGIAASRTKDPWAARLQSLVFHMIFGLGMFLSAWLAHWFYPN